MANPILTKQAKGKAASPEQMNDYIKVSNAGVWIILAAMIFVLVGVLVWGAFGSLQTTVTAVGVVQDGHAVCYAADVSDISVGDTVRLGGGTGKVTAVAAQPVSAEDVAAQYDAYTVYQLAPADWSYAIDIDCADCGDGVQTAKIICKSVRPGAFLFG